MRAVSISSPACFLIGLSEVTLHCVDVGGDIYGSKTSKRTENKFEKGW